MRLEGICLARRRSWCVSQDPDFTANAPDVMALCLAPLENTSMLSADEKPSIQAITRQAGFVRAGNKVVQGDKSTYQRNGTTTIFAALERLRSNQQATLIGKPKVAEVRLLQVSMIPL